MESGVDFVAVEMPSANRFVVHILAAVAVQEAEAISKRTKAALQAAKERGTKLGGRRVSEDRFMEIRAQARQTYSAQAAKGAAAVLPAILGIQGQGITTLRGIAAELNAREIDAPRGGEWSAVQVQRVLIASGALGAKPRTEEVLASV
jgi:DNA invertase Pin-like site-specific DNA recombinase